MPRVFDFKAGQFGEYSVFGAGECTFCIASSPTRKGYIECSFKAVGKVTKAHARSSTWATRWVSAARTATAFPLDEMERARTSSSSPAASAWRRVRCVIWNVLDLRDEFKDVTIVYGARSVGDLVYKRELEEWAERSDVKLVTTVDPGGETPDWKGEVGFVPTIVEKARRRRRRTRSPSSAARRSMIKFTLPVLDEARLRRRRASTRRSRTA